MMKKIAIVTKSMNVGGTEKALISMLKKIPYKKYEITIFVMEYSGELIQEIPSWINVKIIPQMNYTSKEFILNNLSCFNIMSLVKNIYYLIRLRYSSYHQQFYYLSKVLPKIKESYDIGIAYFAPGEFPNWYVVNNINAKKKVTWIHSDVSNFKGISNKHCKKIYSKYDKIFCVSNEVAEIFKSYFPECKQKIDVFYNIIKKSDIQKKAFELESFNDKFEGIKILTVGRLSNEKGQQIIPDIVLKLKNDSINFRWYCIGDGILKQYINKKIKEYNIEDNLKMLGLNTNPYPFIRDCDIYVQPSKYEGYCTTVEEARCFEKPIIMTKCSGAYEQVINNETGFITNFNENEIYEKIKLLLQNDDILNKLKENCKKINIDTSNEILKLDNI